jgi:hypothetical protein
MYGAPVTAPTRLHADDAALKAAVTRVAVAVVDRPG